MVVEAGCHSPWVSRYLEEAGLPGAWSSNPRKLRAIYQNERKSDRRDAQMLARIGRLDPALLYPVRHGTEEAQADLLRIKLRDSLVRARVALINSVRFTLKSLGYTVRNPSSERFHKVIEEGLPGVSSPDDCSQRCKPGRSSPRGSRCWTARSTSWPTRISADGAAPANPRVGPITALYFVLKIEDPTALNECAT